MKIKSGPYRPWYIIGDNNGRVALPRQYAGLNAVDLAGKSVLEVGCAEGLVSIENLKRGARLVHGIEFRERAVEVARSMVGILGLSDRAKFYSGDIGDPDTAFNQPGMQDKYDVVMAMAVIQKVPRQGSVLRKLLAKCTGTFVFRLGERRIYNYRFVRTGWSFAGEDPVALIESEGFHMQWESCGYPEGEPPFPMEGDSWMAVFKRTKSFKS